MWDKPEIFVANGFILSTASLVLSFATQGQTLLVRVGIMSWQAKRRERSFISRKPLLQKGNGMIATNCVKERAIVGCQV